MQAFSANIPRKSASNNILTDNFVIMYEFGHGCHLPYTCCNEGVRPSLEKSNKLDQRPWYKI